MGVKLQASFEILIETGKFRGKGGKKGDLLSSLRKDLVDFQLNGG